MAISAACMSVLVGDLAFLAGFVVVANLVLCEWPAPVEAHLGRGC